MIHPCHFEVFNVIIGLLFLGEVPIRTSAQNWPPNLKYWGAGKILKIPTYLVLKGRKFSTPFKTRFLDEITMMNHCSFSCFVCSLIEWKKSKNVSPSLLPSHLWTQFLINWLFLYPYASRKELLLRKSDK